MEMQLRTEIVAKFVTDVPPSPEEQVSLDALNKHVEDICESLQPTFTNLIIEMLELKRQTFTKGD
jgi:hypothetical protein